MAVFKLLPYLRPHLARLCLAVGFMILFGLFGAANLIAAKPVIEIIFGVVDVDQYRARRVEKLRLKDVDLADPEGLARRLILASAGPSTDSAVVAYLAGGLAPGARALLAEFDPARPAPPALRQALLDRLNEALDDAAFAAPARFPALALSAVDRAALAAGPGDPDLARLNRRLLAESLGGALRAPEASWAEPFVQPLRRQAERQVDRFYHFSATQPRRALGMICAVIFCFTLLKAVSEYLGKTLVAHALYAGVLKIKEDLFAHILRQDHAFFLVHTTGYLESRIISDVKALLKVFEAVVRDAIQQPVTLLSILGVLFYLNWRLTLLALVLLPLAALPIAYFSRRMRKLTRKSQKKSDSLSSHAEEALRNYRVIKVYHSEEFEIGKFRRRNTEILEYYLRRRLAELVQSPIVEVIGTVAAIGVLFLGLRLVSESRQMTGSEFMVYLLALTQFYTPIKRLTRINVHWQTGRVSAERILEIFAIRSRVEERPGARALDRIRQGLRLEDVSFRYGDDDVLRGVDLEIPLGRTIAIVGPSGAGKSSLVGLLPRLYDPTAGRVTLDGVALTEYRLGDLRRRFGVVTQETILFNDTVARNIAYAETGEIDRARVEKAARQAHAHDFILALDGGLGYDTVIGQAGDRLSGGQRQRIAIARAIYRDPEILIFDEATSALDEESQRHVQTAIDNLLRGRTAILIAHRLSTIRHADEIVVMDRGRIVERGAHDALMAARGAYWNLYSRGEMRRDLPDEVNHTTGEEKAP